MQPAFTLGLLVLLVPGGAAPPDAATLARRIDERHRRVADLRARFVQTYRSGALGQEVVERGELSVKRPGRMVWQYRHPERKTFVSDGRTFYFYVPADRQVIVRDQDGSDDLPTLLLSGRSSILEQFTAALEASPRRGLHRLRLLPRKADPEVESVALDVDDEGRIRGLHVQDAQGNRSRFDFEDIEENVGLPDRLFRFEVPKGVEVVAG